MHFRHLALAAGTAATATALAIPNVPQIPGTRALAAAYQSAHEKNTTISNRATDATAGQEVLYWGQNNQERSLGSYCSATEGPDILVLAFLYEYGNGQTPYGNFGEYCTTLGECSDVESDIVTCKAAGKKIFVSLGGAVGAYSLTSDDDATNTAQAIWDMMGNPAQQSNTSAIRPFGQQIIDGYDMDIEAASGSQYYPTLINKFRSLFAADPSNTYYISGAPQCPIPEPNMGSMIGAAKFDMLFIQFYNNPGCSANEFVNPTPNAGFNFDDWKTYTDGGASAGAQLFMGLPASPNGATGTASGAEYYMQPSDLVNLVNEYKSHAGFAGVMLWDAAQSDTINENGCHYSGVVRSVLDTGASC